MQAIYSKLSNWLRFYCMFSLLNQGKGKSEQQLNDLQMRITK